MVRRCNGVAVNEKKKGNAKKEGERKDPELPAMESKWKKSDLRENRSEEKGLRKYLRIRREIESLVSTEIKNRGSTFEQEFLSLPQQIYIQYRWVLRVVTNFMSHDQPTNQPIHNREGEQSRSAGSKVQ